MNYWTYSGGGNYLSHHGIDGQRWGHRNGPPYPLNSSGKERSTRDKGYDSKAADKYGKKNDQRDINKEAKREFNEHFSKGSRVAGVTAVGTTGALVGAGFGGTIGGTVGNVPGAIAGAKIGAVIGASVMAGATSGVYNKVYNDIKRGYSGNFKINEILTKYGKQPMTTITISQGPPKGKKSIFKSASLNRKDQQLANSRTQINIGKQRQKSPLSIMRRNGQNVEYLGNIKKNKIIDKTSRKGSKYTDTGKYAIYVSPKTRTGLYNETHWQWLQRHPGIKYDVRKRKR